MKTTVLSGLLFLFTGFLGVAATVPVEIARQVARNALRERWPEPAPGRDRDILLPDAVEMRAEGKPVYYIFNARDDQGFFIVSADDRIPPLLAYSFSGAFRSDKAPAPAFSWFMNHLNRQILLILDQNLPASTETTEAWSILSDPDFLPGKTLAGVNPMIQTTWGQGCYYNENCPVDSSATGFCYHTPTGCGATSMAQILKFWKAPLHGTGAHSYFHPDYGTLSANFGAATYIYSLMPSLVTTGNPEVAQLMYHCGVAQEMDYGPAGSTSYSSAIDAAFKTYFDYDTTIQWKWKGAYSSSEWVAMLVSELEAGRPMIYYGNDNGQSGHFFICDGYQGADFFHFNWGWGGYLDGYFYTSDLTPGIYSFNDNQGAIFNLSPNHIPPPGNITMDFESVSDFSLTFTPWTVIDADGSPTYQITDHTFPHAGNPMAFICFNPAKVTPSMASDQELQPHTGARFGACFSATTPPNNDWFVSPQIQLEKDGEFSFWVKSYTAEFGLERYNVGVSTTGINPNDFTIISGSSYLEASTQWTKKTFSLSAYNDQAVYVAVQCVSNDAFIFMIDDLEVKPGSQGGLPSYMTLDFEGLSDFTTNFNPWTTEDLNGGNTYGIENISFPHDGEPFAYICFNPQQTTPPLTNMHAYSGSRLGTCFSSLPPHNPNNKWLISPQIQFGEQPALSLWVQSYSDQYGLEQFNIGVSTTGSDPSDFTIVNQGGPETAPVTWTHKSYNLSAFANHAAWVGIQCVSDDRFIFMIDDIEISGNVGIAEEGVTRPVSVFPNPARERIYVTVGGEAGREVRIRLLNSIGQTLYTDAIPHHGHSEQNEAAASGIMIPVKGCRAGLYYLVIQIGSETVVKKVSIIE